MRIIRLITFVCLSSQCFALPRQSSEAAERYYKSDEESGAGGFLERFLQNGSLMKVVNKIFTMAQQQPAPKQTLQMDPGAGSVDTEFSHDETPIHENVSPDKEWKSLLMGPNGVLTEIFNVVKDKVQDQYKEDVKKVNHDMSQAQQDMTPEQLNFAKVFESFMQKAKTGNFDEPLPELPFIGICNRLNCGDIYKAVDEFRKSDMFSNFQTAISLIHDPKGWDIIGNVLANPELIENYIGSKTEAAKEIAEKKNELGEYGIDFSEDGNGQVVVEKEKTVKSGGGDDYYSALEKHGAEEPLDYETEVESFTIPSEVSKEVKEVTEMPGEVQLPKREDPQSILPEISESIDGAPEEYEYQITKEEAIVKEEMIPTNKNNTEEIKQETFKSFNTTKTTSPTTTATTITTRTTLNIRTQPLSTAPPTPKTTPKKNYRVNNDYYAMYYDN